MTDTTEKDAALDVALVEAFDRLAVPSFIRPALTEWLADVWAQGYQTCCGDFDIAARREARSPNPYRVIPPGSDQT